MSRMLEVVFSEDLRTACIFQSLASMSPEQCKAWEIWLSRHGLDPDRIPLGTSIICDDVNRRVYFTTYSHPSRIVSPNELSREECFVQLEAPALPFPVSGDPFP